MTTAPQENTPKPAAERLLFPGAALGFRVWRTRERALVGASFTAAEWEPGITVARCERGHRAPHPECACGLYAFHDLGAALAMPISGLGLVGAVAARGNLQVHATGFRAEQAQVLGLLEPRANAEGFFLKRLAPVSRRAARVIAKRYGVPLFAEDTELVAHCAELCAAVPEELRPAQ